VRLLKGGGHELNKGHQQEHQQVVGMMGRTEEGRVRRQLLKLSDSALTVAGVSV
jgi:hypothetical protein